MPRLDLQSSRAAREARLRNVARDLLEDSRILQCELAERYGVSQSQISKDVTAINRRYRESALEDTRERIGKQLDVYAAIKEAHFPLALEGKTRSAEIVMQALTGESKLLGMDRPVKQEINLQHVVREYVGIEPGDV